MKLAGPKRPAYFLYHLLWASLDWLFPPACGGCGRAGFRWCETCQQQTTQILGQVCPHCGEPQPGGDLCDECRDLAPVYTALRSYAIFQGPLRKALHRLKYQHDIALGEALSKHLIELYNQLKWEIDLVVPIPLSKRRIQERGYNQSGLLAMPLASAIQKPYQPQALSRTRETRTQVGLNLAERRKNVSGGFLAQVDQVHGKVVLLVDDVTTTGSTIDACAQALREAGVSAVYGVTLARAMLKTHSNDLPTPSDFIRR